MSGREWKPGDVAVATFDHGGSGFVFRVVGAPTSWCDMAGVSVPADQITDARPLVVIDAEDREQVERLTGALVYSGAGKNDDNHWREVQAALREFANPTPPKPEEPTGLGAVVEDRDGIRWVRSLRADVEFSTPWRDCNDDHFARHYDAIAAVRVLSEGVTP